MQRDLAGSEQAITVRKADHLKINLEEDVGSKGIAAGFDAYRFVNCALPEIDLDQVDTHRALFGRVLAAPVLISCMTGGTEIAGRINRVLAAVAQEHRFAMGLGSGRALLECPELLDTFAVRAAAPDVLLFANLGAVQLNKGCTVEDCRRLLQMVQADALVLHLNAVQEALQAGGDTCFRGLLGKIADVCDQLDAPVIVKEVGWGIAPDAVRLLFDVGVAAVDVAGAGGTSWSEVERHRITPRWRAQAAAQFAGWGIPTAECLRAARRAEPHATIVASGGLRNGMDVAKALALGADVAGIAGPFLRAAADGFEAASDFAASVREVLRVAMFATGATNVAQLRSGNRLVHKDEAL